MVKENLGGGVSLCREKTDKFKTASVSINIAMPLDSHASARAILPYMLCRSNVAYPTELAFNRRLARLYGAVIVPGVRKAGEVQVLTLSLNYIDDRFALSGELLSGECIRLLCQCLFEPVLEDGHFGAETVEREKRLLIERIRSRRDDKRLYAKQRLEEEMCRCEAFSLCPYGTEEGVTALSEKDILEAWREVILKGVMQVNIVGSCDEKEIVTTIRHFVPEERKELVTLHTEFVTSAYEEKTVREQEPLKQSKLVLGFRANMTYDMDNIGALMVANSLFGGDVHSKLFLNVREKQSLCYYCGSALNRYKGILTVQCGVESENIEKAIDSICEQLDELKKGNFTDEEIEISVRKLTDSLRCVYDSPESIDAWFTNQICCGSFITPDAMAKLIKAVTRAEIIIAADGITKDTVFILDACGEQETEEEA